MEQRLDEERSRIRKIAEPVLEQFRRARNPGFESAIVTQNLKIQTAERTYQDAKLAREIKEIEFTEYDAGISLQDLAAAEARIRAGEAGLKVAAEDLARRTAVFEKIKKISSGSIYDTVAEDQSEDRVKMAELAKTKAELELEQAKSKLVVLKEYEKPKRLKELRAAIEQARADELEQHQRCGLERDVLARMKREAQGPTPPAQLQPILSLVSDAARLDGEIHAKLAALGPNEARPDSASRKTIEDKAHALEAKVSEAARALEDLRFAELAREIDLAATRRITGPSAGSPANPTSLFEKFRGLSDEERSKLKTVTGEERTKLLRKAGFTDAEIQEMERFRQRPQPGR
jgi:hypothetical protein